MHDEMMVGTLHALLDAFVRCIDSVGTSQRQVAGENSIYRILTPTECTQIKAENRLPSCEVAELFRDVPRSRIS